MESVGQRMVRRVKEHPVAVVGSFLVTSVIPFASFALSVFPLWVAIAVSVAIVVALLIFLGAESATQDGLQDSQSPHNAANASDLPISTEYAYACYSVACTETRRAVRDYMLHHFGDKGREDYYQRRVNAVQYDTRYREAVEPLLADPTWGPPANGAQEWVIIGFDTLASLNPSWNNDATKSKLYRAVVDCMLREELNLSRGVEFAGHVKAIVAARRFCGE